MLKRAFMGAGVVAAVLALWVAGPAWAAAGWAIQPVPLPSGGTFGMLLGVSCLPAGDCAAVGMSTSAPSSVSQPLAERWDGSSWSVTPVPLPSGSSGGELNGASCVSAANCVAVGYYGPGVGMPLAERWDGSAWSPQRLPRPVRCIRRDGLGLVCLHGRVHGRGKLLIGPGGQRGAGRAVEWPHLDQAAHAGR